MPSNRATNHDSVLRWLNIVQRGGTQDWQKLYRACGDHEVARQVAASLAWRDPDLLPSARLWKFLIEDLHPDIHIDLHESDNATGI